MSNTPKLVDKADGRLRPNYIFYQIVVRFVVVVFWGAGEATTQNNFEQYQQIAETQK